MPATPRAQTAGRIRKAIVPVAGRATRLRPASLAVPKGLFPLVDADGRAKPVIQLILEEAFGSGIEAACLVTGPGEDLPYRRYFAALADAGEPAWRELAARVDFAAQPEPLGYGHAVYCGRGFAGGEPVLVMLGDHVYRSGEPRRCARQLLDCFVRHGWSVSGVQRTPEAALRFFGTVAARPLPAAPGSYRVHEIVEKPDELTARARLRVPGLPAGEYLCWFGLHALTPAIFDVLADDVQSERRERGEYQLTGAQARLLEREPYFAEEINGTRHDMGDPAAYRATQTALSR